MQSQWLAETVAAVVLERRVAGHQQQVGMLLERQANAVETGGCHCDDEQCGSHQKQRRCHQPLQQRIIVKTKG